jgi:hypothetical protein
MAPKQAGRQGRQGRQSRKGRGKARRQAIRGLLLYSINSLRALAGMEMDMEMPALTLTFALTITHLHSVGMCINDVTIIVSKIRILNIVQDLKYLLRFSLAYSPEKNKYAD